MSDNPYSPPAADVQPDGGVRLEGTGTFGIGEAFSDAWSNTWRSFPQWVGVLLAAGVAFVLSGVTVIGIFLVWPVLTFGLTAYILAMHDGAGELGDLWSGFKNYGSTLAAGLGLGALMMVIAYVGQVPLLIATVTENATLMLVGQGVNLIWSFLILRFYFAYFVWVDEGSGPIAALGDSWRLTGPVYWKLLGLMILFSVLVSVPVLAAILLFIPALAADSGGPIVAGLAALVGLLVMPISVMGYLLFASAYRQIVGRPGSAH